MDSRRITKDITYVGLLVALLCVSSFISFPIPFTPIMITAQTIIINLIGLILSPKKSFIAIGVFLLIGAVGVPVFAGGSAGIGELVGPSGGYFLGFLVAPFIISLLRGSDNKFIKNLVLTIGVGMPIIYFFGTCWLSYIMKTSILAMVPVAVVPFILGDVIKAIVASFIAVRINKIKR